MGNLSSYYDLIASITKNDEVTRQEIALIQKHLKSGHILDIACGSGRHLIPLLHLGYDLSGLDSNNIHLKLLSEKLNRKVQLYNAEFNRAVISEKFDALLLFWNSLNEICHDNNELNEFFIKVRTILNEKGIIIINFDDIKEIDPINLDFEYKGEYEGQSFKYQFKVQEFDRRNNISKSIESLTIYSGDLDKSITAELIQKWWGSEEVSSIANDHGFRIELDKIKANNEIYMILKKA